MSELLFIRHAMTLWNEQGRIQGQSDVPLSPAGRTQVAAWRLPARFAAARCLTSPLARATETAELLGRSPDATDERLKEMNWGGFEGRTLAALRHELGQAFSTMEQQGLDFQPPGGETPRQVAARLRTLLAEPILCTRDHVIVAHKGILRAVVVLATGWEMLGRPPLQPDRDQGLVVQLDRAGRLGIPQLVDLRGSDG